MERRGQKGFQGSGNITVLHLAGAYMSAFTSG